MTAHYITPEWNMVSKPAPFMNNTQAQIWQRDLRRECVSGSWRGQELQFLSQQTMLGILSMQSVKLDPQLGSFAHTINVASQKAKGLNQVSRVLSRVRRVVSFFHRSSTAAHILESKQEMLNIPKHILIHDVTTR